MENCDFLKKEVDLLGKNQSYVELEEKMGRSEKTQKRCEDLEEEIEKLRCEKLDVEEKLQRSERKCEGLRHEKFDAAATNAEEEENVNLPDVVENAAAGDGDAMSPEVRATSDDSGIKLLKKGASYKVSRRCDPDIINKIKKHLDKENLEIFGQSCFGHFLKINELKFQGQLILQLLLRMDMGVSNKDRLVFKINNSNMEFGPSDFFLITGLHFGTSEATTSSSIHKDVFQGRPVITLKEIEEAFLTISRNHDGKGELTLKLALLYFLYGNLLVRNRCFRKIDLQYFHLIEDLQKFNAFPWGRVAYQFLVSSILSVRARIDGSKVSRQRALSFDVFGFSYALQAWAYEMMPSVATYCASHANNFENLTPRILRWSAMKIFQFDDLNKFFTLGDKAHLKNTMEKWEDLSTYTIPQAATSLSRPQQDKRKFICDKEQMHLAQPTSEPSSVATPIMPPTPSKNAPTYTQHHLAREKSDDIGIIKRRLSRVEDMLESILRKFDQPIPDINCDDLPRNESPQVEDEEAVKKAEQPAFATTPTRHGTSGPNPISMNDATDKYAKLERSSAEIEPARALFEFAIDNPALDTPQLLRKVDKGHTRMECLEGRCSSSAAEDGSDFKVPVRLSGQKNSRTRTDNGDDSAINGTRKTKRSTSSSLPSRVEERACDSEFRLQKLSAVNDVDSTDSDDGSCSDGYMNNLVAVLQSKRSRK